MGRNPGIAVQPAGAAREAVAPPWWEAARGFRLTLGRRLQWAGFLFVLPALLHFALFKFYPMAQAIGLSFFRYDLMSPPQFVGLGNYGALQENPLFWQSLGVTVKYTLGVAFPEWFLALGLALLLNRRMPGRPAIRLGYFFPIAMSQIVVALVWKFMYHPHSVVNSLLGTVGVGRINWLSTEATALPALIAIGIWRGSPLFAVVYLAGLQAIPREYHEAAEMDGAGAWQRFWHITLPMLLPTVLFIVVTSLLMAMKVFLNPLVMTEGGPNGTTRVLPYFVYETGFAFYRMGEAAAASTVLFALAFLFTLVQFRLLRRGGVE